MPIHVPMPAKVVIRKSGYKRFQNITVQTKVGFQIALDLTSIIRHETYIMAGFNFVGILLSGYKMSVFFLLLITIFLLFWAEKISCKTLIFIEKWNGQPYETWHFNFWHSWSDSTSSVYDRTKSIVQILFSDILTRENFYVWVWELVFKSWIHI